MLVKSFYIVEKDETQQPAQELGGRCYIHTTSFKNLQSWVLRHFTIQPHLKKMDADTLLWALGLDTDHLKSKGCLLKPSLVK